MHNNITKTYMLLIKTLKYSCRCKNCKMSKFTKLICTKTLACTYEEVCIHQKKNKNPSFFDTQMTNKTLQKTSFSKILPAPNIEQTTHTGSILKISVNQNFKNTTINKKRELRKDDKNKIENTKLL